MNAPLTTPMHDEDLARADAYAVLARLLFAAPDAAFLQALQSAKREGEGEGVGGDELTSSWNALCDATQDGAAIAAEYDSLFVSIGKPLVSLYASWYLTGFLMEKPLALLRDDLNALGLARNPAQHDPEDHIAGELDVMRHLILNQGMAISQAAFFQRHLKPWYVSLCKAVLTTPESNFYRAVAQFMRVFLDMEADYFAADGGVK